MFTNLFCQVTHACFLGHSPALCKQRSAPKAISSNKSYFWLIPGLVFGAHLLVFVSLRSTEQPLVEETLPIPLQVSLVPTPQVTPAKPVTQVIPKVKADKPVPPKPVVKKLIQAPVKAPPLIHKAPVSKPALVTKQPVSESIAPAFAEAAPVEKITSPIPAPTAVPAPAMPKVNKVAEAAPNFQSPSFNAAYLHNPAPNYPSISRRLKEEGRVLLRVQVNADGSADSVELATSSGFSRLDQAALEAVKNWLFTPAKRNQQAVSASVMVPVRFSLEG